MLEQRTLGVRPSPTSFTPSAGIPGTNVTITGNNFSATTSQNAVLFGTTKANIVSSTTTQLVVTVPKGSQYGPITVINLSTGLLTKTNQSFNPLFDNNKDFGGEIIPASLSRGLNTVVQNGTEISNNTSSQGGSMGAGDIDGDGWVDLVGSEKGTQNHLCVSQFRYRWHSRRFFFRNTCFLVGGYRSATRRTTHRHGRDHRN